MNKLIYFISFCALWSSVNALNCTTGYKVESQIINDSHWTFMECPDDGPQTCLRSEGSLVIFGAYTVNMTTGSCASQTTCDQECRDVVDSTLIAGFAAAAVIDTSILSYKILSCQMACCNNDNCNQHSVEKIQEMKNAVATITPRLTKMTSAPPTTTQAPNLSSNLASSENDILECIEGFEVISQFLATRSWNRTQCRRDLQQKCIRGEGVVVISEIVEVNITTAFCANQSSCEDSCVTLFESVISDLDPSSLEIKVLSCLSACCDSDYCNNQSISDININSPVPATTRPTAQTTRSTTQTTRRTLQLPSTVSTTSGVVGTASSGTLNCITGYQIRSSVLTDATWNLAGCPANTNQRCLRSEVEARLFDSVDVSVVSGSCVDSSACEQSCEELTRTLFFSSDTSSSNVQNLNLDSDEFMIRNCRFACCENNNCNNRTVTEIVAAEERLTTPTTTSVSSSIAVPALECYSGYQADAVIFNDRSWRLTRCSSGPSQRCVRAEAVAHLYGIVDVTAVVGFCVDVSECDDRVCNNLVDYIKSGSDSSFNGITFSDADFTVNSCRSICCTDNSCNDNPIPDVTITQSNPTIVTREATDIDGSRSSVTTTTTSITPTSQSADNGPCIREISCKDENTLFLMSIVPRLNSLPKKTASEVKIRMMELLHEAEFGNLFVR